MSNRKYKARWEIEIDLPTRGYYGQKLDYDEVNAFILSEGTIIGKLEYGRYSVRGTANFQSIKKALSWKRRVIRHFSGLFENDEAIQVYCGIWLPGQLYLEATGSGHPHFTNDLLTDTEFGTTLEWDDVTFS